jgi:uncharacterized membrane protein YgdD (TMEM256/DUF423 family)
MANMHKTYLIAGTALAGLAVVLGAFGAHGLKSLVPAETVSSYQIGVQYQMYHAIILILIGILYDRMPGNLLHWAGLLFITGIILFSGSLYFLASLKAMDKVGVSGIGIITPVGGLFFIAGWILLLVSIIKN